MRLVAFLWCVCGGCLLFAFLVSAITVHPNSRDAVPVLFAVLVGAAIVAAGGAVKIGRLPHSHWVHQSQPGWTGAVVIVALVLWLLSMFG